MAAAQGEHIGDRGAGGSSAGTEIATWVAANFTATQVDGVTLYDLTAPTTAATSSTATPTDV